MKVNSLHCSDLERVDEHSEMAAVGNCRWLSAIIAVSLQI